MTVPEYTSESEMRQAYADRQRRLRAAPVDLPDGEDTTTVVRTVRNRPKQPEYDPVKVMYIPHDLAIALSSPLMPESPLQTHVTMSLICSVVADWFGLERNDFRNNRKRKTAWNRQIAMYLCHSMTAASLPEIGKRFNRDHTTVRHGVDRVIAKAKDDPELQMLLDTLERKVRG